MSKEKIFTKKVFILIPNLLLRGVWRVAFRWIKVSVGEVLGGVNSF
jgi:hypothetical protein